jgi:hypothetical protein
MAKLFQGEGLTRNELLRLDELSARFGAFRKSRKPGTRIPRELREDVLAALREGLPPSRVYAACRLTGTQVSTWRSRSTASGSEDPVPPPRVLSVVHECQEAGDRGMQMDVRIGPWRFCLTRAVR